MVKGNRRDGFPNYPLFERDPYLNRIRENPEFVRFMANERAQWNGIGRSSETTLAIKSHRCAASQASRFRVDQFCRDLTVAVLRLNLHGLPGVDSFCKLLADQYAGRSVVA